MFRSKKVDITGGPIVKSIIIYAIPLIVGSLIQMMFNAADVMIVGNMSRPEDNAVASIGATTTVISLLVTSFLGLSVGLTSTLARALGQRNDEKVRRIVSTAIIFALSLGVVLMVVFILTSKSLLRMLNCPEKCFDGAVRYFNIYAVGIPAITVYNFASGIIRTQGDTKSPFFYLATAGVSNIALNVILCLLLRDKVSAVAIATTASQLISCILALIHLLRLKGVCRIDLRRLTFSPGELWEIVKIGAPCALNSALFALSNLQIQAELNTYGPDALAGNTASINLANFIQSITSGFNGAVVPFVGQNLGAGNERRVKQSVGYCLLFSVASSLLLGSVIYIFGDGLLSLFVPGNAEAVAYGKIRMRHTILFYFVAAGYGVFVSAMQAFGVSFVPMINSIVSVLGFRIVWMGFIYPQLDAANRAIANLYVCYTLSWILTLIVQSTTFFIVYILFKKGKIRKVGR